MCQDSICTQTVLLSILSLLFLLSVFVDAHPVTAPDSGFTAAYACCPAAVVAFPSLTASTFAFAPALAYGILISFAKNFYTASSLKDLYPKQISSFIHTIGLTNEL